MIRVAAVFVLTLLAIAVHDASWRFCAECRRAFGIFGHRRARKCWKCWRVGQRWPAARLKR